MSREILIGRSDNCDIRLDSRCQYASGEHGVIYSDGSRLMYRDTSANGTVINNVKVHHRAVTLHRGDIIMIAGRYRLKWSHIDSFLRSGREAVPQSLADDPVVSSRPQPPYSTPQAAYAPSAPNAPSAPVAAAPQYQEVPPPRHQMPVDNVQQPTGDMAPNVTGFSWAAFVLSGIWGLFNGCWWMLLIDIMAYVLVIVLLGSIVLGFLVPIIGIIKLGLSIWFGVKGRDWAWKNRTWSSALSFNQTQKTWNIVGIVLFVLALLTPFILIASGVSFLSSII